MSYVSVIIAADYCPSRKREQVDATFSRNVLRELKPHLERADYRMVNVECPLAEEEIGNPIIKSGPNLLGLPQNISFLKEGAFDCAILANNHLGDYGDKAVIRTLGVLEDNNIEYVGGGKTIEEAYRAVSFNKDNLKISFLAVCENEFGVAEETKPGAAGFSHRRLFNRIQEENNKSDFTVVIFHGGNEHNPCPSPSTVERYRMLIDFGADAVVAMHTHCCQGYEYYNSKPIVYSMGNFYFPSLSLQNTKSPWNYGYMTNLLFCKGEDIKLEIIPYKMTDDYSLIHVFEGKEKEMVMEYIEKISMIIQNPDEIKRLYKGWSVMLGVPYSKTMRYSTEFEDEDIKESILKVIAQSKNLFSCEAHTDLMKSLLTIELNNEIKEALDIIDEIKQLQEIPI